MAYTSSSTYFLLFKDERIAKITSIHHSLGWLSGKFEPLLSYNKYSKFLLDYARLENDWGETELWNVGIESLKIKF